MENKIINEIKEKNKELVKKSLKNDKKNKNQAENSKTYNKKEDFDEKINDILLKRAFGYSSEEVIEEFQDDNGDLKLIKRKVTKKDIPPDITAVKILLEKKCDEFDFSNMSDEELENMRSEVMLNLLQEFDNTNTGY